MGDTVAMGLPMAAVALRKGMFPAHSWLAGAFEKGSPLATVLFYNGHLGALLLVRAESDTPGTCDSADPAIHKLGGVVHRFLHLVPDDRGTEPASYPRFALCEPGILHSCGSPAAVITALTGALIHWLVVAAASTGLVSVYRASRSASRGVQESTRGRPPVSAAHAPRLAVFFVVCGLALVGLPGTLGYCAEDLLFHGALEAQPVIGLALISVHGAERDSPFPAVRAFFGPVAFGCPWKSPMRLPGNVGPCRFVSRS